MKFRMEMGWTDETVWRRQPAHQVFGWAQFAQTIRIGRGSKDQSGA